MIFALSLGFFVSQNAVAKVKTKSLPKKITNSRYGFLSAGSGDTKQIKSFGASWVRPHPGPFLWDSSQSSYGAAGGDDRFLDFYQTVFSHHEEIPLTFDIANVHCISNDSYENFNVEPYRNMLAEFGLDSKPIWVTEAEAIFSDDATTNAQQTYNSTQSARALGAQRIFFTRYSFEGNMKQKDVKKWYKRITKL